MALFVVRLSDLLPTFRTDIEDARIDGGWNRDRLQAAVDRAFGFLGAFTSARVERGSETEPNEVLVLEFNPPERGDTQTAERRFARATRDAEAGRVRSALPELERLAQEFPEVAKYHRAIGQAYLVLGDFERAEDSMLRSLSLNSLDPDALTLLGNIYAKRDRPADAVPLYERSLAIRRNVYALNNLGAAYAELGDLDAALRTLREAAKEDPKYPNTWFGIALTLSRQERLDVLPEALSALDTCLRVIERRDRAPEIWDSGRGLLDSLSGIRAREEVSGAQEAIRRTLSSLATDSDIEVRIEEQALRGVLAKLELSWVHHRSYHRLVVTPARGPEREHHILHELQHLRLLHSARQAGTNRWFASTAASREKGIRSMEAEIARIERLGLPHDTIVEVTTASLDGLLGQLFNFPVDLLIESRLYATYPDLRELLYQSLKSQLDLSASIAHNVDLQKATPKQIFRANAAMNGAFALWFEAHYPRRTDLVDRFQKTDAWSAARRLYTMWTADSTHWSPGDEYDWIDQWAEALGLRGWYTWRTDDPAIDEHPGHTASKTEEPAASRPAAVPGPLPTLGPSGPLDASQANAALGFMLGALAWADGQDRQTIGLVAAKAAKIGQGGIAYRDTASRYDLVGYSNEPISGLQLLSVMYVLIKQLDPALDQGIDLEAVFSAARGVHDGLGPDRST
jgi:tetratricopeptide (TPR) repeat protein